MSQERLQEDLALAAQLKVDIDKREAETKAVKEEFSAVTERILKTLELMEVDSVKSNGFLFYKETKSSVTTPKNPAAKEELFQFLRNEGIFTEMVSVHSQTLNALYRDIAEREALKGNVDFQLPGCEPPTPYTQLKMRRV